MGARGHALGDTGAQAETVNVSAFDAAAQSMQAHKLRTVGFLAGSAPFASSAPEGAPFSDQYPPKDNQLYVDSLLRFAGRYPSFEAWQIWNEPNIYPYWRPSEDAEAYGKLLFASTDALHARFPEKTVVAAGAWRISAECLSRQCTHAAVAATTGSRAKRTGNRLPPVHRKTRG